jgi:hypothetical protein
MSAPQMTPLDVARAAWGESIPDWVTVLARACTERSQAAVARDLNRSGAVISQVLRKSYPAGTTLIEERVRGEFMAGQVDCPALGPLSMMACQDWREKSRTFVLAGPRRAQMFRACNRCPRNAAPTPPSVPEEMK